LKLGISLSCPALRAGAGPGADLARAPLVSADRFDARSSLGAVSGRAAVFISERARAARALDATSRRPVVPGELKEAHARSSADRDEASRLASAAAAEVRAAVAGAEAARVEASRLRADVARLERDGEDDAARLAARGDALETANAEAAGLRVLLDAARDEADARKAEGDERGALRDEVDAGAGRG
jgi:hypothetical protein